jgi:hypothetical protein
MTTTSDQVHSLIAELRESSRHAEKMFKSHTTGQLQHRPGEGRWSAAECIAHLNLSNRGYLSSLGAAIRELRGKAFPAKHIPLELECAPFEILAGTAVASPASNQRSF